MNKYAAYLKSGLSIAVGGAAGALVEFFTNAHANLSHVDWHQLGINAAVGAMVAVCHYLLPSPVGKS